MFILRVLRTHKDVFPPGLRLDVGTVRDDDCVPDVPSDEWLGRGLDDSGTHLQGALQHAD